MPTSTGIQRTSPLTLAILMAAGIMSVPVMRAQMSANAASTPKFDVASIKRCGANETPPAVERGRGGGGGAVSDPGMFRTGCVSLRLLIQSAYIRYADGQ